MDLKLFLSGWLLLIAPLAHSRGEQAPFVNEYSPSKSYSRYERVAYIQLPKAVGYIVYSGDDHARFRKHSGAVQKLVKSAAYLEVKHEKTEREHRCGEG